MQKLNTAASTFIKVVCREDMLTSVTMCQYQYIQCRTCMCAYIGIHASIIGMISLTALLPLCAGG